MMLQYRKIFGVPINATVHAANLSKLNDLKLCVLNCICKSVRPCFVCGVGQWLAVLSVGG